MTSIRHRRLLLEHMAELLELPESAYQQAEQRYTDLGHWFDRNESLCRDHDPHVFPQGSFRLGTAIGPLDEKEEYDLDLACELRTGITKQTHTQRDLKKLVGREVEAYRVARRIQEPLEEKHRCWRLEYSDRLSFHMDIVPCIPEDESRRGVVLKSMLGLGEDQSLAAAISDRAVSITDDRHQGYTRICEDWHMSNPEGYALWFESRMEQEQRSVVLKAQVDKIPVYKRKGTLQRSIQLLKRHRDVVFEKDSDVKPASIVITTLAARAFQGEADIETALESILNRMAGLVSPRTPRIPNPVNPNEDFADSWSMPQNSQLNLEDNFWSWLRQAQADLELLGRADPGFIASQVATKFSLHMDSSELADRLALTPTPAAVAPKTQRIADPPRPWIRGME